MNKRLTKGQIWFQSLTTAEKRAYQAKRTKQKNIQKAQRRKEYSIKLMRKYKGLYRCSACIHGKTGSCTDNLPNGCEYYYNAVSKREFELRAFEFLRA